MLLKYRISPLLLSVIFATLMYFSSLFLPQIIIPEIPKMIISIATLSFGLAFVVLGVCYFKVNKTTVNPTKPELATTLVTSGIYSITRNPMYVGFLLCLFAWALFLSNYLALLLVLVFFIYMTMVQIPSEEKALKLLFGKDFTDYQSHVRRWL